MDNKMFITKEEEDIKKYPELRNALFDEDNYDSFVQNKKIKMVGCYLLQNGYIWYSFPKYYDICDKNSLTEDDRAVLKKIIRVIDELRKRKYNMYDGDVRFVPDQTNEIKRNVNIIELSQFLINDYIQNGLYVKEKNESSFYGGGKNAWGPTIKRTKPIISDNIIYNRIVKRKRILITDRITEIHIAVLKQALGVYESFYGRVGIDIPESGETIDLNDDSYVKILEQEMLRVFSDREINLLKALISWFGVSSYYRFFGCTNCFQNVWQWVNDAVFGNQIEKKSKNPIYEIQGVKYTGTGDAQLDTLYFDENDNKIIIFDSKYYYPNIEHDKKMIYGFPPSSDITKQVSYLRKLLNSIYIYYRSRHNLQDSIEMPEVENVFLVPELSKVDRDKLGIKKQGELYTQIGYVYEGSFDAVVGELFDDNDIGNQEIEEKKDKVIVYEVYCNELYDMFLKGKKFK